MRLGTSCLFLITIQGCSIDGRFVVCHNFLLNCQDLRKLTYALHLILQARITAFRVKLMAFYGVPSAGEVLSASSTGDTIQLGIAQTAALSASVVGLEGNDVINFGAQGKIVTGSGSIKLHVISTADVGQLVRPQPVLHHLCCRHGQLEGFQR